MGNQYQNFVRAQMKTRETQLRNQTVQEDERKSRNIALGQMIATGITQGAGFRKGLIEDKFLGKTTETGEKMYEYADSPDSTLGLIKRKLLPGQKDFQLTKAGQTQRDSIAKSNTEKAVSGGDYSNLPEAPKGDILGDGVTIKAKGFRNSAVNESVAGPVSPPKGTMLDNNSIAKMKGTNPAEGLGMSRSIIEKNLPPVNAPIARQGAVKALQKDLNKGIITSAQKGTDGAFRNVVGASPNLKVDGILGEKTLGAFSVRADQTKGLSESMGLVGKGSGIENFSSKLDEIKNLSQGKPAVSKVAGAVQDISKTTDGASKLGQFAGKAGGALNVIGAGMSAKDLVTGGAGRTGAEKDKNRLGAAYDLTATGVATFGGPIGAFVGGGMTLGKLGFNALSKGGRR